MFDPVGQMVNSLAGQQPPPLLNPLTQDNPQLQDQQGYLQQLQTALQGPQPSQPFNPQYAMMDEEMRKGKVAPQLADQFGGAAPVASRPVRTNWSDGETKQLKEIIDRGGTQFDAAKQLGRHISTIRERAEENGVKLPELAHGVVP